MYKKVARGEIAAQSFETSYEDERFKGIYQVFVFRTGHSTIAVDFMDITEKKQIEKRLREKLQELEAFNKFAIDRELKMIELKETIAQLEQRIK